MDKLVVGILAHVDAGKTTLSEGLLYTCGRLKKLGRVDHQDAFLDTDPMERARGITIFSKQAVLPVDGAELTLLDTPGHADFSSEMERTLQVLDYAILVISATTGSRPTRRPCGGCCGAPHPHLPLRHQDGPAQPRAGTPSRQPAEGAGRGLPGLHHPGPDLGRGRGLREEGVLERYLDTGTLSPGTCPASSAWGRSPRCSSAPPPFGGGGGLPPGAGDLHRAPAYGEAFAARVFKIARDHQATA